MDNSFKIGFLKAAKEFGMSDADAQELAKVAGVQDAIMNFLRRQGGNIASGTSGMFDRARQGVQGMAQQVGSAMPNNLGYRIGQGVGTGARRVVDFAKNNPMTSGAIAGAGAMSLSNRLFGGGQQQQPQQIPQEFKFGFVKAAKEANFTEEEALGMFEKIAFGEATISPDEIGQFKGMLRNQPSYGAPDGDSISRQYNIGLLNHRDRMASKDPQIEGLKGGLGGGAMGAGMGFLLSKLIGKGMKAPLASKLQTPMNFGLTAAGAAIGGLPAAQNASNEVNIAKKLQDPNNLQAMISQLSNERRMANNGSF